MISTGRLGAADFPVCIGAQRLLKVARGNFRLWTPFPGAPRDLPSTPWGSAVTSARRAGAGRSLGRWGASGSSRRPPGRAGGGGGSWGSALARSLAGRAGGAMSGEDGPAAGPGAAAAAARERRREQLRQWGARAGAEPGPGERRARTVRFERAAEFLAACAGGDLDEARLMLCAADPGPGAELDPAAPPPARAVLDSTNADGISALHQVSAPSGVSRGQAHPPQRRLGHPPSPVPSRRCQSRSARRS